MSPAVAARLILAHHRLLSRQIHPTISHAPLSACAIYQPIPLTGSAVMRRPFGGRRVRSYSPCSVSTAANRGKEEGCVEPGRPEATPHITVRSTARCTCRTRCPYRSRTHSPTRSRSERDPSSRQGSAASQILRAVLAVLSQDIEFAPKCLLPWRSGDAEHLAQARQIEPRIGRAYGLGRKILCRDRVAAAMAVLKLRSSR